MNERRFLQGAVFPGAVAERASLLLAPGSCNWLPLMPFSFREHRTTHNAHTCPCLCTSPVFQNTTRDAGFDAVLQFRDRISSYIANGHPIDKIEILVLGGTWSEYPEGYQVRNDCRCSYPLLRPGSVHVCSRQAVHVARLEQLREKS